MSDWGEGYITDIAYTSGFYRELTPVHVAFSALCRGRDPGPVLQARHVLDLGFGMGFGLVVTAAANPDVHFEGIDFNPRHAANAQALVDAAQLTNVTVGEASFQQMAGRAREGQHDVDLIVLHGILSWVSAEARDAILEIARKRLKPGGLLYVSYNCMPGLAHVVPLQHLLIANGRQTGGTSHDKVTAGIELLKALKADGALLFKSMNIANQFLDRLKTRDKTYLAHEYFNANWSVFHVADVAEMMARGKLDYVASATIIENFDRLSVPEAIRGRIAATADPVFAETLRDAASNKAFRRDIYGRGAAQLLGSERAALLGEMQFILVTPRSDVKYKVLTPLGELSVRADVGDRIADLLATKPATFAEILPLFGDAGGNAALETLAMLVQSQQVSPVRTGGFADETVDPEPARRLNAVIAQKAWGGRTYSTLSSPVLGSGLGVAPRDLPMLSAVLAGRSDSAQAVTDHILEKMRHYGSEWVADGKTITDPAELRTSVYEKAEGFLAQRLPLWRRLKIV